MSSVSKEQNRHAGQSGDLAQRSELERKIHASWEAGDLTKAATLALESYGPEITRYVRARMRTPAQAEDAFLQFCEDLWVGLQTFRWQSSLRVWLFVLARNAATRVGRAQGREALLCGSPDIPEELERLRTSTALFLQTGVKDRMREIRQQLSEEEQTLLILRIDRNLEWKELAQVLGEAGEETTEEELARAAARLRTRFGAAKKRLRTLAEAEGLVAPRPD